MVAKCHRGLVRCTRASHGSQPKARTKTQGGQKVTQPPQDEYAGLMQMDQELVRIEDQILELRLGLLAVAVSDAEALRLAG